MALNIKNAAINAKLHVSLLDLCSILDSLWKSDHKTKHHTHLIQEHYSVYTERSNQARPIETPEKMSRRSSSGDGLFIGRLSKNCRVRDLEDVFEPYGRMTRCEIKYGTTYL